MREYRKAGAVITDDLSQADTIVGGLNIRATYNITYEPLVSKKNSFKTQRRHLLIIKAKTDSLIMKNV